MVWLTGFLTALLILLADWTAQGPVQAVGLHLLTGLGCVLIAPAFAVLQSCVSVRRWQGRPLCQSRADWLHRTLVGSNLVVWLFGCTALIFIARWPSLVRENWGLGSVLLLDELTLVLPMIASLVLAWWVLFDAEQSIDPGGRSGRGELTWQRLRTFFGLIVIPILALFLMRDSLALFWPEGPSIEAAIVAYSGFTLTLLAAYPWLLSWIWQTSKIRDKSLLDQFAVASREAGLRCIPTVVWNTGGTICNAMVVGMIPGTRRIFLTDRFLQLFEPDEIAAIYRHELGHLVHHHLPMRVALIVMPFLPLATIAVLNDQEISKQFVSTTELVVSLIVWTAGLLGLLMYFSVLVAKLLRQSEIQADLFAITRPDGSVCSRRAATYRTALLKMAAGAPELFRHSSPIHPSIQMRLEIIRRVVERPELLDRFTRRFQIQQWLTGGSLLAAVALTAWWSLAY